MLMGNWSGSFWSKEYTFLGISYVRGKIDVNFQESLDTTNNIANLKYTGLYRRSENSEFIFSSMRQHGHGSQVVTYTFKGMSRTTNQHIDFDVITLTENIITGTYTSENPFDYGTFELRAQ